MTALDALATAAQDLVRDRLRLSADEAAVTGVHYILPKVLQGLEDVLSDGVYEGSHWWDCFNHVLEVFVEEGDGLPPGIGGNLGNSKGSSRVWLVSAVKELHSLEEFFTRMLPMTDVLQAYYKSDALLSSTDNHRILLKAMSRLAGLTFRLGPKDARLFDTPRDLPSPLMSSLASIDQSSVEIVKEKEKKKKATPATSGQFKKVETMESMAQTDPIQTIPVYELESRLDAAQRKEMKVLKLQMNLKDREMNLKQQESSVCSGMQMEEDMLAIKQLLSTLAEAVPAAQLNIDKKTLSDTTPSQLSGHLDDILESLSRPKAQRISSLSSSSPSLSSPLFQQSTAALGFTSPTISFNEGREGSVRARSCALSPSGCAQVIFGDGIDALTNIHEDFFVADSDDEGIPNSSLGGSFRSPWLNFEGLETTELGDVKKDRQTAVQGSRCAGCGATLPSSKNLLKKSRLCNYTGKYFCKKCHHGKTHVLPSLVIHRWDFTPQKVCNAAHWHLSKVSSSPLLRISELNTNLYSKIDSLDVSQRLREALVKLVSLLPKKERKALAVEDEVETYKYCLDDPDLYSMSDLHSLKDDLGFISSLKRILSLAVVRTEKISTETTHDVLKQYNVRDMVRD